MVVRLVVLITLLVFCSVGCGRGNNSDSLKSEPAKISQDDPQPKTKMPDPDE